MDRRAAVYPAPAFDVYPNVGEAKHVLKIDDVNNRTSPATILDTAAFYGLDDKHNRQVLEQIASRHAAWIGRRRQKRRTSNSQQIVAPLTIKKATFIPAAQSLSSGITGQIRSD